MHHNKFQKKYEDKNEDLYGPRATFKQEVVDGATETSPSKPKAKTTSSSNAGGTNDKNKAKGVKNEAA